MPAGVPMNWDDFSGKISREFQKVDEWKAWFSDSTLYRTGTCVTLVTTAPYKRNWIAEKYTRKLQRMFDAPVVVVVAKRK
jgi:hypothetical protein